jgi:hypothetical protein
MPVYWSFSVAISKRVTTRTPLGPFLLKQSPKSLGQEVLLDCFADVTACSAGRIGVFVEYYQDQGAAR